MKVQKKTSVAGAFARKEPYSYEGKDYEADILDGDRVVIKSKGDIVTGEFGDQLVFSIETRNGDKNANFNQSSINTLIDAYGDDTDLWVGKAVKVLTKKGIFGGKRGIAAYFVTDDWTLDDFGDLVRIEPSVQVDSKVMNSVSTPAMPESVRAAQAINPEDIPF